MGKVNFPSMISVEHSKRALTTCLAYSSPTLRLLIVSFPFPIPFLERAMAMTLNLGMVLARYSCATVLSTISSSAESSRLSTIFSPSASPSWANFSPISSNLVKLLFSSPFSTLIKSYSMTLTPVSTRHVRAALPSERCCHAASCLAEVSGCKRGVKGLSISNKGSTDGCKAHL